MTKPTLRTVRVCCAVVLAGTLAAACGSDAKSSDSASTGSKPAADCTSVGDSITQGAGTAQETAGIDGVKVYSGMSQTHTKDCVDYPQTPPVGGNHSPVWQGCEFYDGTVVTEQAVHSMEHGAVWIAFSPSVDATQRATLKAYSSNDYVLISKWASELPSPVVASAWGRQIELTGADDPRLRAFVEAFANGPQTPEPGVPCREGGTMEM